MGDDVRTRIINKIHEDVEELHDRDALVILEDPEIQEMVLEQLRKDKSNLPKLTQKLFEFFGMKKEFVRQIFEEKKLDDPDDYYDALYNSKTREGFKEYIQYTDGYDLMEFVLQLAEE